MRTRITPTPSGFLHLGNAFNFQLTWNLARRRGASIYLRIDDFDPARARKEYIEDIFYCLAWLKIGPWEGPQDPHDFDLNFSLRKRQIHYWSLIEALRTKNLVYACECSRSQTNNFTPNGVYKGTCRDKGLEFRRGKNSLRLRCHPATIEQGWRRSLNDFVVWTREDWAAYQLVSVAEDLSAAIDLVVRGEDLRDSTGAQAYLAEQLGGDYALHFAKMKFIHHPLLMDPADPEKKISKSLGAHSLSKMISMGFTLEDFHQHFERESGFTSF